MRRGTVRGFLLALALALVGAAPAAALTVMGRVLEDVTELPANDNGDAVAAVVTT